MNSALAPIIADVTAIKAATPSTVSVPWPQLQAVPPTFGQPQEMVVDLVVKIGDKIVNYNSLPSSADIADSYSNGEQIVISDNREAMNAEIINYKQKSLDTINSIQTHKDIVNECEIILNNLNPEYAEKKQQQDEISTLKSQMTEMSKNLTVLTQMMEQFTKKDINKEQI